MRSCTFILLLLAGCTMPGCMMVQVSVSNPMPGLTTVAVVPFLNLSDERAVDGRRFASIYVSELQKVPGFEVLPVGVAEVAIVENKLNMNDRDEVLRLAKALNVDAIVIGAVTDYSPYYPPRLGLQINWYSPKPWDFYPGIQIEPETRGQLKHWDKERLQQWRDYHQQLDEARAPETPVWHRMYRSFKRMPGVRKLYGEPLVVSAERTEIVLRGQSPPTGGATTPLARDAAGRVRLAVHKELSGMNGHVRLVTREQTPNGVSSPSDSPDAAPDRTRPPLDDLIPLLSDQESNELTAPAPAPEPPVDADAPLIPPAPRDKPQDSPPALREPDDFVLPPDVESPASKGQSSSTPMQMAPIRDPALAPPAPQPNPFNEAQPVQPWQLDPTHPLMSYTRVFDGADADFVAALRDYVELNGDLRSGGWKGYLQRSDDFIRFASYRMILEMLSLHGGEGKHRIILKLRNNK